MGAATEGPEQRGGGGDPEGAEHLAPVEGHQASMPRRARVRSSANGTGVARAG
jgi:hypothetical protein